MKLRLGVFIHGGILIFLVLQMSNNELDVLFNYLYIINMLQDLLILPDIDY